MSSVLGVSVVIPSWNGRALLEKFLPGVLDAAAAAEAALRLPTEVLVADDSSDDDTLAWLATRYPQVRFEPAEPRPGGAERHQGFGPTANRGVAAARYQLVYLVNNDVALAPETLSPLVPHFAEPAVFAVASQVYDYESGALRGAGQVGAWRRGFLGIHRRYFVRHATAGEHWLTLFASGGSALFEREKFLALGGFDDLLAPFGWEDVELSLRAWTRGYEIRYEPRSPVWHQFSSTIPKQVAARQARAIYERNRLLTHWLHLDEPLQGVAHVAFLLLKLLASPLAGRFDLWRGFLQALSRWGEVQQRRAKLRAERRSTLRAVLAQVTSELRRPEANLLTERTAPVRAYRHG